MTLMLRPVEDLTQDLPISIGISGPSGSGKTYTALRIARGMSRAMFNTVDPKKARIVLMDTENRRGLHYREAFPEMIHGDMPADDGWHPDRWIKALDVAERAGFPVITDSFSHAWEGHPGGVLEMQALKAAQLRGSDASLRAWAEVKPIYRRLIDRIIRAKVPIILCTRAKKVIRDKNGKPITDLKVRDQRIPYDIASDKDLLFEMTAQIMLDPSNPGAAVWPVKLPDQLRALFPTDAPMTEDLGHGLIQWSRGEGQGGQQKRLLDQAREVARNGTEAFRFFYAQLEKGGDERAWLKPIMPDLQKLAAQADRRNAAEESDDPFEGLPPEPDPEPVESEEAAREREERARQIEEDLRREREEQGYITTNREDAP